VFKYNTGDISKLCLVILYIKNLYLIILYKLWVPTSKLRNKLCDCESIIFPSSHYFLEYNIKIL